MAKKKKNKLEKYARRATATTKFIWLLLFVIFACGGVFTTYAITKNDTFELIGESQIELLVGDTYVEQGAKAIAFGKDISADVYVIGSVDTSVEGEYVLKYQVDHFRFKGYTLYKKIVIKEQV